MGVAMCVMLCLTTPAGAQEYALFFDNNYVDQADEATKLRNSMTGLGLTVNTFTGITQSDFSTALAGAEALVIPEMQNGSLYPALDADTRALLTNFVEDGGLLLITARQDYAAVLINGLFGTSIASGSGGASTLDAGEAAGTVFASGPASLSGPSAVVGFSTASLSAEALAIYQNATGGTTVMLLPEQGGNVVFLGFDWFTTPAPADWVTVLEESATLYGNVWNGSVNNSWTTSGNWSRAVVPGAGDAVIIGDSTQGTINHDQAAGTIYSGIRFNSTAGGYNVYGNALGISDGGSIVNESAEEQTFSTPFAVHGAVTIETNGGYLFFSSSAPISIDAGGSLTVTGTQNTIIIGAIEGDASLVKTGSGQLALYGANSYTGGTTISEGLVGGTTSGLQGDILNNGAIVFWQSTDGTYAGNISGTGSVSKGDTGTVTFTGTNSYTGSTWISGGRLNINGSITSNTTVDTAGTLGGTGTIAGTVVNNGTVAPGNSIGTLWVQNSFTSAADAEVEIEINDGGTTPGTNVDLLRVMGVSVGAGAEAGGATATILGGTVNVVADPGTYTNHSQYTFLEADSVVGEFDSIIDDLEDYHFELGYTLTSAYFTLLADATDYATWGCTPNTVALGTYLDSISQGATGDLEDLLEALDAVAEGDRCRSLAQLNGAIYGSLAQLGLQNSTLYLQSLARRLRTGLTDGDGLMAGSPATNFPVVLVGTDPDQPLIVRGQDCCCPRWATWAIGFGLGGNAESDGNAPGLDYSLGGVLFGAENMVGDHLLGFYGGYLGNYVETDVADSAEINGAAFGSYLVRHDGCNYYIVISGLEFDDYESTRQVQFDGLSATGDFDGWKGMAYVERGLTLGGPCLRLQPLAALQYIYLREDRFSEHGAGAANLDVAGIDAHSFRSALGARAHGRGWSRRGRCITPEMRALWIHEFLEADTALNARFNPVGGAMFAVDGLSLGRDWVLAGVGLNWQLGGGWEAYADYDAFVNDLQTMHVGSGGISHVW